MQWLRLAAAGLMFSAAAAWTSAEPLNTKTVPANAKWVLQVDADAAKTSQVWTIVQKKLQENPQAQERIQQLEGLTGMKFPQDLHDVTLYGREFTPESVVLTIRAMVNQVGLTALLQANPSFASAKHDQYDVLTWQDKGKTMYGSFHGPMMTVISQSKPGVEMALDLLDGKGEEAKSPASLVAGAKPGILAYISGEGLAQLPQLQKPDSPVAGQLESAWLSLAEQGQNAILRGVLTARSPETAEQMRTALEGIRAMVQMAGSNENADPKAKLGATALQTLSVKVQGSALNVDWSLPLDVVQKVIDLRGAAPRAAATQKQE